EQLRTGLPYQVERVEDLFVTSVPKYTCCTRYEGEFDQPWNMGEEYRPDPQQIVPSVVHTAEPQQTLHGAPAIQAPKFGRPVIAFGPRLPDFGSWDWVGADIADELSREFDVRIFDHEVPLCDLVVFVKFKPAADAHRRISQSSAIIHCPIDFYGSSSEIDADAAAIAACDRVLIHCERLRRHFAPYASVEYMDHHVKFAAPLRPSFLADGPLRWVGVRTNLPPLVDWVNRHHLPEELWVLTNPENPAQTPQ